jgi:lipoyl(octanoyl) transferase
MSPSAQADSLEVHLLGLADYDAVTALQQRLVYEISGRVDTQGTLLLCEHPPVITIGREGSRTDVLADPQTLQGCAVEVRWVARGGGALMHAPGQLAVYPVLPLDRLGLGVSEFRSRVEESLAAACREATVVPKRTAEAPGLWCRGGQLASLGAAVKSGVSLHGAFLNVCPDPSFLCMVDSWPTGERVTSLEMERCRPVSMPLIREAVLRHFAQSFGYDRMHAYTGHPLLQRRMRQVCLHA